MSSNASVALEALIARGCVEPKKPLTDVLDDMHGRFDPRGFFYEPFQLEEARSSRGPGLRFVHVTATYLRILLSFRCGSPARLRAAFDWLADKQDEDGAWRPPHHELRKDETISYRFTRAAALAFAELSLAERRRYAPTLAKAAAAWADRVLDRFEAPDAVLTTLNIAEDSRGPARTGAGPQLPETLRDRIIYFPLEDLWLALAIGADPTHPHLEPWIDWLLRTQRSDGSWRLRNPTLRERLLLSDPNGRLRAEALFLTDEWITMRGAQILRYANRRPRARVGTRVRVTA